MAKPCVFLTSLCSRRSRDVCTVRNIRGCAFVFAAEAERVCYRCSPLLPYTVYICCCPASKKINIMGLSSPVVVVFCWLARFQLKTEFLNPIARHIFCSEDRQEGRNSAELRL